MRPRSRTRGARLHDVDGPSAVDETRTRGHTVGRCSAALARTVIAGRGWGGSLAAAVVALLLVAGCGERVARPAETSSRPKVSLACRRLTSAALRDAKALLRAYAGYASPGDVAFYDLREDLGYGQQARCRPAELGEALVHGLTRRQLRQLLSDLPSTYVSYLHQAVACSRTQLPRARCSRPAAVITPPGAGTSSGTSEPLAP